MNYGDEFVQGLIPREPSKTVTVPLYHSKYKKSTVEYYKTNKQPAKTMGKMSSGSPKPLKKGTGALAFRLDPQNVVKKTKNNQAQKKKIAEKINKKPPVPSAKSNFNRQIIPIVNKIKENALNNIKSKAKKPLKEMRVDHNNGHNTILKSSGLVPFYVNKGNYGEVPNYLTKRNNARKRQQRQFDDYVEKQVEEQALKKLDEESKANILATFKERWENLNHEYQGLSVVTDTIPKKNRKENLENELLSCEKEIKFLESNDEIFIDYHH